jgi:hypothetical protein
VRYEFNMMTRLALVLVGGLAFWMPAVLIEVLSNGNFSIRIANVVPLACALCVYWLLLRGSFRRPRFLPLYLLAGIYLFGPLAITIATSVVRGTFAISPSLGHYLFVMTVISVIPPLTMLFVGNNGLIFALLGITVIFVTAAIWSGSSSQPRESPRVGQRS